MTKEAIYQSLKPALSNQYLDFEIREKAALVEQILEWKKIRNAAILGHNYMEPALFLTIPDVRGDSLELARKGAAMDQDVLVVAGVTFMAETVKLLNPNKMVLIPDINGCSLAKGISAEDVRRIKHAFPGLPVVTYINSYAEVKAESDYCFTSGNANKVVEHVMKEYGTNKIICLPDEYYAANLARDLKFEAIPIKKTLDDCYSRGSENHYFNDGSSIRSRMTKDGFELPVLSNRSKGEVLHWDAKCEVHEQFNLQDIESILNVDPKTIIMAHPECSPEVIKAVEKTGGFAGGTSKMIKKIEEIRENIPDQSFALLTECSMKGNVEQTTGAKILSLCGVRCPHMARITLANTLESLQKLQYEITVPEDIAKKARLSVERMLGIG